WRELAKAVAPIFSEAVPLFASRDFRKMPVGLNAERGVDNVICWNECRHVRLGPQLDELRLVRRDKIKPHLHIQTRPRFFPLQLGDRLLEELAVEIKPYGHDVATLGSAENAAGAADFQIAHRDAETGA